MAGDPPALHPLPWRLQDPPPAERPPALAPLLLLLDCREPLPAASRDELRAALSPAERERHQAYRRPEDQERFLRARTGLRKLLAAWLQCSAAAVTLETGAHGKPFCPGGPEFNLSHSGDLILLALHHRHRVGVDLERLRPGLNWEPIARRVLSEPQRQALAQQPAAARLEGFLAQWCALEAELKASGTGFSGLNQSRDAAGLRRWQLQLPQGYLGAAALLTCP